LATYSKASSPSPSFSYTLKFWVAEIEKPLKVALSRTA